MAEVLVIACVGLVYWRGHHQDWQGQWLVARPHAELSWYLPLVAPLRGQCQYHLRVVAEQHALQHRVHMVSTRCFP